MKKIFALLMCVPLLLCGCSAQAEETDHADVDTTVGYQDVSAFLKSDFCKKMEAAGKTFYLPVWDGAKFALVNLYTSNKSSVFTFRDTETDTIGYYQITYDSWQKSVKDFADGKQETADDQIVTVEKDGTSHEVYLSAMPDQENAKYNLSYIPYEGIMVYIGTERSTTEEILADFESFDLVPADEWQSPA